MHCAERSGVWNTGDQRIRSMNIGMRGSEIRLFLPLLVSAKQLWYRMLGLKTAAIYDSQMRHVAQIDLESWARAFEANQGSRQISDVPLMMGERRLCLSGRIIMLITSANERARALRDQITFSMTSKTHGRGLSLLLMGFLGRGCLSHTIRHYSPRSARLPSDLQQCN